jgi:NAD(P)-dependent dehydrogenase (short-subunit alcohol dehydrogenase family)
MRQMPDKLRKIVIIDGQGGGIGRALIEKIRREGCSGIELVAVGTNALATSNMLKAGADAAATGESAIVWNCRGADIIIGALGIIAAGSMYGELSHAMAAAISASDAVKILIPVGKCHLHIVGITDEPLPVRIDQAVAMLEQWLADPA